MPTQTPLQSRIVAVCSCVHFDQDAWLFSDFALLHSLAPQSPNDIWLSCKNLAKSQRMEKLRLHGEPTAPRIVIPTSSCVCWATHVPQKHLKARFLEALSTGVQATTPVDHLIVIIVGHGADDGSVGIGEHRRLQRNRYPRLLRPEEVLDRVRDCQGPVTLIVNTCHSGRWAEQATTLGLAGAESKITILTRCQAQDEIWSLMESESMCMRGGYFINCLTGQFYGEYALLLPRPVQIEGQAVQRFGATNLTGDTVASASRKKTTGLNLLMKETNEDMQALTTGISPPTLAPPGRCATATIFFGVRSDQDLPLRITSIAPANPSSRFDTSSVSGSLGNLVHHYMSLPLPEGNAASNVYVSIMLRKLTNHKLGFLDRVKLKQILTKRLALYDTTFTFVKEHGLDDFWPKEPVVLAPNHWEFIRASSCIGYFTLPQRWVLTPWVDCRNLLVTTMERAGVTSQEFDMMCERKLK